MFRDLSEVAELVNRPSTLIMVGFVSLLGAAFLAAEHHVKRRQRAAHVRGYVRPLGHWFELGLRSLDTGKRHRLGVRPTLPTAEDRIHEIMSDEEEVATILR